MIKCRHKTLFFLSGTLWLAIGIFLLTLGFRFLFSPVDSKSGFSLLALSKEIPRENMSFIFLCLALFVGYFKGKYLLSKSVYREVTRISQLSNPTSLKNIYSKRYYLLVASMIALGFLMRYLPITQDTRGVIDITIGSALLQGAKLYYRQILTKLDKNYKPYADAKK